MFLGAALVALLHGVFVVFSVALCAATDASSRKSPRSSLKAQFKREFELQGCPKCCARVADFRRIPKLVVDEKGQIVDRSGNPASHYLYVQE
ncbi:hypothetical protein QR680_007787 [Steinernema hermaphroditum]|uniref:Selenoprotein F/M domain-containing protein n=1 Tax=Steinernema hermaphroditum TaxID=289476 RepID=A0AA39IFM8_9BILA|nr:hypothetical protein QR680_007787 [Steinernema hermaphroditum]